ncbi:dihydrodipicolinate reductase C-terminal domain-containing protein [Candidatus Vidania fulgoroideorum]
MIKISICGYLGNISKYLINFFIKNKEIKINKIYTNNIVKYEHLIYKNSNIKSNCSLIFTNIKESIKYCKICCKNNTPIILGTTGFKHKDFRKILLYSKKIPIFFSSNFNTELINFFFYFKNLSLLKEYNVKGYEIHNIKKYDCPSGSSFLIENIINKNIYFNSIRYKNILGQHEIIFYNKNNYFSIKHNILNKECYIKGIIKSIKFIINKKNGLYKFSDL